MQQVEDAVLVFTSPVDTMPQVLIHGSILATDLCDTKPPCRNESWRWLRATCVRNRDSRQDPGSKAQRQTLSDAIEFSNNSILHLYPSTTSQWLS